MTDLANKTLGNFRIGKALGIGSMGTVYKARDMMLHIDVAVKVMHPQFAQKPEFQKRFRLEARSAAAVKHPNIVGVRHFAQEEQHLYMVMDYIPGDNLRDLLNNLLRKSEWLPLPEALALVRVICQAIEHAHQSNVIHRDIKPANIMLQPDKNSEFGYQPIVTDLGLAKIVGVAGITQSDSIMGTPAYMSPEQVLGPNEAIGAASDIYALGVLLYELVISKPPIEVNSLTEIMRYHAQEPQSFPDPQHVRPDLPDAIALIIRKALRRYPAERHASAGEMAAALEMALKQKLPKTLPESAIASAGLATLHQESIVVQRGHSLAEQFERTESAPPSTQDQIQVVAPNGNITSISVPLASITIGREEDNILTLQNDPKLSRHHALIEREGGCFYVTDLDSTNGLYIEGQLLESNQRARWHPHETLRVGNHYLRIIPAEIAEQNPEEYMGATASWSQAGRADSGKNTLPYPPKDTLLNDAEIPYEAFVEGFKYQPRQRVNRRFPIWATVLGSLFLLTVVSVLALSAFLNWQGGADGGVEANGAVVAVSQSHTATPETPITTSTEPSPARAEVSQVVTPEPTAALAVRTTTLPTAVSFLVAQDIVNIRKGPGVIHPIIDELVEGQQERVIGSDQEQGWFQIEVQADDGTAEVGWVSGTFVEIQNGSLVPIAKGIPTSPPTKLPTSTAQPTNTPPAAVVINRAVAPATSTNITQAFAPIELLKPDDRSLLMETVTFRWKPIALSSTLRYEAVFWKDGQAATGLADKTTETFVTVNLDQLNDQRGNEFNPDDYSWGVRLIRADTSEPIPNSISQSRTFTFSRGSPDCGAARCDRN